MTPEIIERTPVGSLWRMYEHILELKEKEQEQVDKLKS